MLKHVNVKELERQFVKLLSELLILRARFYREASASLNEVTTEFESCRCEDGGLTEHATWMLGLLNLLQRTLAHQGIHAFMDAFDDFNYEDQCQIDSKDWYALGNEVLRLDCEIKECKKQLSVAKQNCQLKQALKDAGF